MKLNGTCYAAAAILSVGLTTAPCQTKASRNYNLSINSIGRGESCADIKVSSNNGQVAQSAETMTLRKSDVPILELDEVSSSIRVKGWDRGEYSVETCKFAVAETSAAADQMIRGISVTRSAGRFTSTGPNRDAGSWQLYYIIHAPKDANVDLQTKNGPIEISDIAGNVKARATNGPVSISDCGGHVEVRTQNGPISLNGSGGEAYLTAQNGPISLNLTGDMWNGSKLDARTVNGPVSLNVSENFHSGIRVETDGHSPMNCAIASCRSAWTDASSNQRVLQMNGSTDTVRVSTSNGPVSVGGSRKNRRVI